MASFDVSKQMKRLNELLKEQQEPFCLHVYLLERGYSMKRVSSKGVSECCRDDDSSKELKSFGSPDLKRVRSISKIMKSILEKIVYVKNSSKMLGCDSNMTKDIKLNLNVLTNVARRHHVAENRSSSASSLILMSSDSSSDCNTERKFNLPRQRDASQVCELRNLRNESDTDSKQSSPVSILEEPPTGGASSFHYQAKLTSYQPKRVTEDVMFSPALWDMLVHSLLKKQDCDQPELARSTSVASQYLKTKGVLEQRKQLLFDCVREILNTHGSKRRKRHAYELLGSEELGKIICRQILQWGKQSGNVGNINQLMDSDFCESMEEWNDFQLQTKEIEIDIGDAILDDIREETVTDIIDSFAIKGSLMM